MPRVIGWILLLMLALQTGLKPAVVAWWTVNQARIARTLCENRDKPQLKCCGRCVLRKKLQKAEGAGKTPARPAADRFAKQEPAVVMPLPNWSARPLQTPPAAYHSARSPELLPGDPAAPFHPPQA